MQYHRKRILPLYLNITFDGLCWLIKMKWLENLDEVICSLQWLPVIKCLHLGVICTIFFFFWGGGERSLPFYFSLVTSQIEYELKKALTINSIARCKKKNKSILTTIAAHRPLWWQLHCFMIIVFLAFIHNSCMAQTLKGASISTIITVIK